MPLRQGVKETLSFSLGRDAPRLFNRDSSTETLTVVPDIAQLLAVGAVTGMRRGELTGLRRSRIFWDEGRLTVDTAITATRSVKGTKTRKERSFYVDAATMESLRMHCKQIDERAALFGATVSEDGYVFSLEPECSRAMPPYYVTKRVSELKDHLGIADKKPETIALQDQALRCTGVLLPMATGRMVRA